jgi:hypothetical protein
MHLLIGEFISLSKPQSQNTYFTAAVTKLLVPYIYFYLQQCNPGGNMPRKNNYRVFIEKNWNFQRHWTAPHATVHQSEEIE